MSLIMLLAAAALLASNPAPKDSSVLAAPGRTAADQSRDADRRPLDILAFSGVVQGAKVGEYTPGGGYLTRLLSPAVGPAGHVYAYPPAEIVKLLPRHLTDAQATAAAAPLRNVTVLTGPNGAFAAPEPLDLVITVQNYHDLHTRFAPPGAAADVNAAVFRALKPGGAYVIIDHRGGEPDRLHRIDPAQVRGEVEAAGFVFEAQGEALANSTDPRSASVFDPAIRGRTDQFMLRFRRP